MRRFSYILSYFLSSNSVGICQTLMSLRHKRMLFVAFPRWWPKLSFQISTAAGLDIFLISISTFFPPQYANLLLSYIFFLISFPSFVASLFLLFWKRSYSFISFFEHLKTTSFKVFFLFSYKVNFIWGKIMLSAGFAGWMLEI